MDFITLDRALDVIADDVPVPEYIAARPRSPVFVEVWKNLEATTPLEAWKYSKAAGTLHQDMVNSPNSRPQWVEIHRITRRPVVNDAVASDGMGILVHTAGWHDRKLMEAIKHIDHCSEAGVDPLFEPPLLDPDSSKYTRAMLFRKNEIGFDRVEWMRFYRALRAAEARAKKERQVRGFFTLREAAEIIVHANPGLNQSESQLYAQFLSAVARGELVVREPATGAPTCAPSDLGVGIVTGGMELSDWITSADVDALLAAWGVSYRFPASAHSAGPDTKAETNEHLAPAASGNPSIAHRMDRHRDVLAPVIDSILQGAGDAPDSAAVWNELVRMADATEPHAPLLGFVDGEGVKYQGPSGVQSLNREALNKRLKRRADKAAASRR